MIPLSKPTIGKEEIDAASRVLKSGWLAAGPETEKFEKEFAEYVGVKYAIFTNSCTSALKMAYKYAKEELGLKRYVLYNPNTYCATYAAAEEIGLKEWDSHRDGNTEMVGIAVSYGGVKKTHPANGNLFKVTDSAHRIEQEYDENGIQYFDNFDIKCYSFHATKNMTTGSGGMFVTNERSIYEKARLYWRDGLSSSTQDRAKGDVFYKVQAMAGGYDGNDIAASIGRVQLKRLSDFIKKREIIVSRYNNGFSQDWTGNHLYPYFVKSQKEVKNLIIFLKKAGIQAGYHYPNTGWLGVSLPLYPLLKDKEVEYVIKKVKEWREK